MSILPVIDLKDGRVVHGIAGNREAYRPVESVLTSDPSPSAIAAALRNRLSCNDVYIADLDAIAGRSPAYSDYSAIAANGLQLWIDAGIADLARATDLLSAEITSTPIHRIIIALETLRNRSELISIINSTDALRLVFSIDLKNGQPLAASAEWSNCCAVEIANDVIHLGIRNLIVLDLAQVGVDQGTGTEAICAQIKNEHPTVTLIGGGGVSSPADVDRLCAAGLSRVLVASAIHDGRLL